MSGGRLFLLTILKIIIVAALSVAAYVILLAYRGIIGDVAYDVGRGLIILASGVVVVSVIGNAVTRSLVLRIRERAYVVGNSVKVVGYLVIVIVFLAVSQAASGAALFGGAVSGLVLGLALQPVLGNFFAGIIVLATRFVEVGDDVRVLASQVPYQWAMLPAYKFFSPDYVAIGYRGRVVEVGLIYTTIITEGGQELRVPNLVLLTSGVLDYTPQRSDGILVNVRVEFPLSIIDFEEIEDEVREALRGFPVDSVMINEQSDKDHVIILVRLRVPVNEDWRMVKSEALKNLLRLRDELINRNMGKYLCLTKGVMCTSAGS